MNKSNLVICIDTDTKDMAIKLFKGKLSRMFEDHLKSVLNIQSDTNNSEILKEDKIKLVSDLSNINSKIETEVEKEKADKCLLCGEIIDPKSRFMKIGKNKFHSKCAIASKDFAGDLKKMREVNE